MGRIVYTKRCWHYRPQSSSASRFTAGAAGFSNLSQSLGSMKPEDGRRVRDNMGKTKYHVACMLERENGTRLVQIYIVCDTG